MGQSYCRTCCADKHIEIQNIIDSKHGEDEPRQNYAKSVKHYIDIHPKVKEVYLQNRIFLRLLRRLSYSGSQRNQTSIALSL